MKNLYIIRKRTKPLLLLNNNEILVFSRGVIYSLNSKTYRKKKICKINMSFIMNILSRFRIFERMFRLEPRVAIQLDDNNVLISFKGNMYKVNLQFGQITLDHKYRAGVNNPLSICKIKDIEGFSDCIVYGEYSGNPKKESVHIYKRDLNLNDNWVKVFEFPGNSITHIHSIVPDPYRNGVLILTGDDDNESGIWLAKNDFKDVQPLVLGTQQYRACNAFPLKDGILYATDTPMEDNNICILKNVNGNWVSLTLKGINGSCIYATQWKDKFVFSTTVEPDSSIKGKRYWFTYKRGNGIKSNKVEVLIGDPINGFEVIADFEKDVYPMLLMQFGSVQFCSCKESDELFLYPVAVKKYDNRLISYSEGTCE